MTRFSLREGLTHLLLVALAFATLFPFYWMIVTSFRPASEIFSGHFSWLPETFVGLENYRSAFAQAPLVGFMVNGVIVCAGILAAQLLTAIPCGYALAKFQFRGRNILFGLVLLVLTVPIQVPSLPLFMLLAKMNLLDSYLGLMLPFFLSVFAIFLFRQVFRSFPDEVIQAARMDGLSEWEMAAPALAQEVTTIEILQAFPAHAHFHEAVAKEFMAANPDVEVKFRAGAGSYDETHQVMLRAALTNRLPDVYHSGYHLIPEVVTHLAEKGQLVPLDEFIAAEAPDFVSSNYPQSLFEQWQVDGTTWGIGFNASTPSTATW